MNDKELFMFSSIQIRIAILALTIIFITGCIDGLKESSMQTFTQPQPVNAKTLMQFPGNLKGKYLSLNDSSFIKIDNKFILRIYERWYKIPNAAFDSSFVWENDSVVEKGSEKKYFAIKGKDGISVYTYFQDTVIVLNASTTVLKKFKSNYFLNQQLENHNWFVKMISISKDSLMINDIEDSTLNHTSGYPDTGVSDNFVMPKPLNLSKKEFKQYIRDNSIEKEVFIQIE